MEAPKANNVKLSAAIIMKFEGLFYLVGSYLLIGTRTTTTIKQLLYLLYSYYYIIALWEIRTQESKVHFLWTKESPFFTWVWDWIGYIINHKGLKLKVALFLWSAKVEKKKKKDVENKDSDFCFCSMLLVL